jgi:hypothetical protein
MKKILIIGLILVLTTCVTNPTIVQTTITDELDTAIRETSDHFNANLTAGNMLAFLFIQSDFAALSEYIIDELIANTVNDRKFLAVDRQQLDAIRSELNFQLSGEVDDNSAQRLGQMLGAQIIISGGISQIGDFYRLRIRALDVETARIVGQFNRNIPSGPTIDSLVRSSPPVRHDAVVVRQPTVPATTVGGGSQPAAQVATAQSQLVDPSIPMPTNIRAAADGFSAINISWRAAPSVAGYNLYVATASNGAFTFLANTSEQVFIHEGLEPNSTRFYRLSSVGNNERESPLSTAVTATTRQLPVPSGLTATIVNSSETRLTWHPVEGAVFYRVYGSATAGGNQPLIITTSELFFNHAGLQENTTYHYRVSAVIGDWEGELSVIVDVRTPRPPVTPPGETVLQQLAWISRQGGSGAVYEIIVNENINIGPTTIMSMGVNKTVILRSADSENIRIIQLEGHGHLFTLNTITLQLQDIELKGHGENNAALILIDRGRLVLNSGAKITGNTNNQHGHSAYGGGIFVHSGFLEINDGAEISGNTVHTHSGIQPYARGGGIFAHNNSTVLMRGGIIARNRVIGHSSYSSGHWAGRGFGGAIYMRDSSFTKQAASDSGSGIIFGSTGPNANTSSGGHSADGHAVWRNNVNPHQRNATLGPGDDISTTSNEGWGQ